MSISFAARSPSSRNFWRYPVLRESARGRHRGQSSRSISAISAPTSKARTRHGCGGKVAVGPVRGAGAASRGIVRFDRPALGRKRRDNLGLSLPHDAVHRRRDCRPSRFLVSLIAFPISPRHQLAPSRPDSRHAATRRWGSLDVVLPGLDRKDEIGEIAGAVETFKVKAAEKAQARGRRNPEAAEGRGRGPGEGRRGAGESPPRSRPGPHGGAGDGVQEPRRRVSVGSPRAT